MTYLLRADATDDELEYHRASDVVIEGGYDCGYEIYCRGCLTTVAKGFEISWPDALKLVRRHLD